MSHHGGFTKLKVPENLDELKPSEETIDKMFPEFISFKKSLKSLINRTYGNNGDSNMFYQDAATSFIENAFYLIDKFKQDPLCYATTQCLLKKPYVLRISMHGNLYMLHENFITEPIEYLYCPYEGNQMDRIGILLSTYLGLLRKV